MRHFELAILVASLAPLSFACGSSSSGESGAGPSPEGGTDAAGATALVRVAHLSPDAPAVDFCLAAHGSSTFEGPVLKGAGNTAGLSYPSVTAYLKVAAGQYDVRIVAPDASGCATSLAGLPDFKSLPALAAGGSYTLAAEGEVTAGASTPFGLDAYVDEATVASGKASLRFVHASPGTPPVDVGLGSGTSFTPLFSDVAFGATATGGSVDSHGYLVTAPLSAAELSARAHGATADALVVPSASLPAGAIATAFAIGELGSTTKPLAALLCVDNAAPTASGLSSCAVVGDSLAHVRVAHLSPDAPAVDVCVKSHTAADYPAKPLLQSLTMGTGGLSYPQVTTYVDLAVDAYDVRIVAPDAADCTTALGGLPDTTTPALAPALYATVGALGDLNPAGSDPAFALHVFVDDSTVASGKAAVRFIHASPGTPAVDVGLVTGTKLTTPVFVDVAFGQVAQGAGIDADGYYSTTGLSNVTLGAAAHGSTTVVKSVSGVSVAPGALVTAFAIGNKTGQSANPLQVLLCDDNAATKGVLTTCAAQ